MHLDHLAVTCADLAAGVAYVQDALGVALQPGGQHARYSTHNRLLSLGPGEYLEVIAPDPAAPKPEHPIWFGLGQATTPRLGNWIVRVPDLAAALIHAPVRAGAMVALERGELKWRIAVPQDGSMPFGGAYPTLIEWQGTAPHPSTRLTDVGVRLTRLEISHPQTDTFALKLAAALPDPRLRFHIGPMALRAWFDTPSGPRTLG